MPLKQLKSCNVSTSSTGIVYDAKFRSKSTEDAHGTHVHCEWNSVCRGNENAIFCYASIEDLGRRYFCTCHCGAIIVCVQCVLPRSCKTLVHRNEPWRLLRSPTSYRNFAAERCRCRARIYNDALKFRIIEIASIAVVLDCYQRCRYKSSNHLSLQKASVMESKSSRELD